MNTNDILNAIDQEISKLQQARTILAGTVVSPATTVQPAKRRGRPKGSGVKATVPVPLPAKSVKKALSSEAKARIAAAQVARWAAKRKAVEAAERAAKRASAKPAKTATKVAAKRPAKSSVKTSSAKKASGVKRAAEPQAEVASTSV